MSRIITPSHCPLRPFDSAFFFSRLSQRAQGARLSRLHKYSQALLKELADLSTEASQATVRVSVDLSLDLPGFVCMLGLASLRLQDSFIFKMF